MVSSLILREYLLQTARIQWAGVIMETQQMFSTARKVFAPFETANIVHFTQNFSFSTILDNPLVMILCLFILFMGIVKRSKTILLTVFTAIALMFLMRYTLPADPGAEMSLKSTIPFAFGGLGIGSALIYFLFIKGE
jgi:hypothetical protein